MLAISSVLVFLTTFLAAGLAVLIGWFAIQRAGHEAMAEDVSEHLLDETPGLLKNETLSTISPWARLLERSDFVRIIQRHLLQSGLKWSVRRITLSMLLSGSLALGIAMQFDALPGWADLPIATAVAALPYLYILQRRWMPEMRILVQAEEHVGKRVIRLLSFDALVGFTSVALSAL